MCKMCYLFDRNNIYIVQDHVTLRVILINITPPYKFYWINILKISTLNCMFFTFLTRMPNSMPIRYIIFKPSTYLLNILFKKRSLNLHIL